MADIWNTFMDSYMKGAGGYKRPELENYDPDKSYGANMMPGSQNQNPNPTRDMLNGKIGGFAPQNMPGQYGPNQGQAQPMQMPMGGGGGMLHKLVGLGTTLALLPFLGPAAPMIGGAVGGTGMGGRMGGGMTGGSMLGMNWLKKLFQPGGGGDMNSIAGMSEGSNETQIPMFGG